MGELSLSVHKTKVDVQKIEGSRFEIFEIIIAFYLIEDKDKNSCFLKKTFLLANISIDIVLGIFFLTLSNVKIDFTD